MQKRIKQKIALAENASPRFELISIGDDVAQHDGIRFVYLSCPHCSTHSRFTPVHSVVVESTTEDITEKNYHYICQCEHCEDVVYVKFWEVDADPDWHFAYEMHAPEQASLPVGIVAELKPTISATFTEATICFNAGAYLACLVMCRRSIEAIFTEIGSRKGESLAKAIERFRTENTLHGSMLLLADMVRLEGNAGAHGLETSVDRSRASESLQLTRQLIDILFVVPSKHAQLKERISRAK